MRKSTWSCLQAVVENYSRKVCRLKSSLYGLKKSPRGWFDCLIKIIKKHGYLQGQSDYTLL